MSKKNGFTPLERNISNRGGKRFLTAFTLIELLVVIAIVALLMSILMPALTRVRKQAKSSVCQMNLRHWGIVFSMYTDDNDGYLVEDCSPWIEADQMNPKYSFAGGHQWPVLLLPYYRDAKLRFCPVATRGYSQGAPVKYAAWQGPDLSDPYADTKEYIPQGSYGLNSWCSSPPQGGQVEPWIQEIKYWRKPNVRGAHNVPVLLDCWWAGGFPRDTDDVPPYEGWIAWGPQSCRYCIDRHDGGYINAVFLDWSVRKVGLREMYRLKWHRKYDIYNTLDPDDPSVWPEWMQKFKNYYE